MKEALIERGTIIKDRLYLVCVTYKDSPESRWTELRYKTSGAEHKELLPLNGSSSVVDDFQFYCKNRSHDLRPGSSRANSFNHLQQHHSVSKTNTWTARNLDQCLQVKNLLWLCDYNGSRNLISLKSMNNQDLNISVNHPFQSSSPSSIPTPSGCSDDTRCSQELVAVDVNSTRPPPVSHPPTRRTSPP